LVVFGQLAGAFLLFAIRPGGVLGGNKTGADENQNEGAEDGFHVNTFSDQFMNYFSWHAQYYFLFAVQNTAQIHCRSDT
jgi:hypothetical protein